MTTDHRLDHRDEFGRIRKNIDHFPQAPRVPRDRDGPEEHYPPRRRQEERGRVYGDGDATRPPVVDKSSAGEYYGPAHSVEDTLPPGTVVHGRISRLESYGAFMDFEDPKTKQPLRGLIHISHLSNHRVEQVSDTVKQGQSMYAVILEVEYGRDNRIRLSLKDVDQVTGKYRGALGAGGSYQAGSRPPPPRELARRAKQRRDMYTDYRANWLKGSEEWNHEKAPGYIRQLWSASPEPPGAIEKRKNSEKRKKTAESDDESRSSSSSSSTSESSSSSDSEDSSEVNRRRRKRTHDRKSSRKLHRSQSDRRGHRSSRRRRRRSSRRESRSSTSSSSSSQSSSEPSDSTTRIQKKIRRSQSAEKVVDLDNQADGLDPSDPVWKEAQALKETVQGSKKQEEDSEEDGPMPLPRSNAAGLGSNQGSSTYGKALLPGEGQAIAQYVQNNLRIPRRGEIGYSGDDIEHFESSGYVMSGSRHQRMNAVRIRKENQVYSAEEQRALALITMEENQQKESQLMEDFRIMLKEKQKMREKGTAR